MRESAFIIIWNLTRSYCFQWPWLYLNRIEYLVGQLRHIKPKWPWIICLTLRLGQNIVIILLQTFERIYVNILWKLYSLLISSLYFWFCFPYSIARSASFASVEIPGNEQILWENRQVSDTLPECVSYIMYFYILWLAAARRSEARRRLAWKHRN